MANHSEPDPERRPSEREMAIAAFGPETTAPGTAQRYWLEIDSTPFLPMALPVIAVRGVREGRTLLTVAGVHGDEYEGMEAIRQIATELDPATMSGQFIAIIIANPFAYAGRSRATPATIDGLNLARVFPGDPAGLPTERLAAALLALAERIVGPDDLVLDFHSGSADVAFTQLAGFRAIEGPARQPSEAAARHMGLPRLWAIPDAPGPLNAETARRGLPTVGTETTGRAGCLPEDVAAFTQVLRNLLAYLSICPDWPRPVGDPSAPRLTTEIVAPTAGFCRVACAIDDTVAAGDLMATIVSRFGEPLAEIRAPAAGQIWAARATPAVGEGELLFYIAH